MCRSWPNLFLGVVNQTTNDGVYEEFDELAHEIAGRVMSDGSLKNIPYEVMTPEYNHHGKLGLSIRQEEVVCHWVISSVAVSVKLSTTEGEPISTDLLHDLRFSSPAVDADATANPE
ncbi:hypothetical protein EHS25_008422 [Saitozyma podzolica]|uniref:Uncharacterized protein n=1 Tax=Saitozyma podzolica TaxID=1890683 RepID=A0A427YPD4_9TREE|nr:hypothetical protein EHS25_008422 [Saitozyma podzolica]